MNSKQMKEIREGLEDGLDVSIYADPKFDDYQMTELRLGLWHGIDASTYANPEYSALEMSEKRIELENHRQQERKYIKIAKKITKKIAKKITIAVNSSY